MVAMAAVSAEPKDATYIVLADFAGGGAAAQQPALRKGERVEVAHDASAANGWVWGVKADNTAGWLPANFLGDAASESGQSVFIASVGHS